MESVKDIINLMDTPSKERAVLIEKAYNFAKKAHEGHTRYSGEPYFNHLFETAKSLARIGMGSKTIAAGLLHDTVEDAEVSEEEVEKEFGKEVLFLVQGVTKLGTLKYRGAKRHTESLRKLFVATSQDVRVLIIKLMDRLHNMQTLEYVPKNKQKRIALETLEIYAPIADRLGMGRVKRELDDLAFPYVYQKEYRETVELLKQKSKDVEERLEKITKLIKKELAKRNITKFRTEYRIKGVYSLYRKLQRKDRDVDKIYDIAALRIIVPSIDMCYTVLGIVHGMWRPIPGKVKDYIAFHKPNGYQSLHTTVFTGTHGIVEIQIRTEDMHKTAQYGIASHLSYKEVQEDKGESGQTGLVWVRQLLPSLISTAEVLGQKTHKGAGSKDAYSIAHIPAWIKEIAEVHTEAVDSKDSKNFLDTLKSDFFSHRVFVFTPKGDVVDLPLDSSPIDFAYAIHSDIGDHIAGAKVNGKLASLDTHLKNGDIVEIVNKSSSHPTQKWLEVAKTTLAQRHIRAALVKEN